MQRTFSYDVETAKVFGVNSAIFIQYLISAETLLGTLDIERNTIIEITGMEKDKQEEVESLLLECGVISMKPFRMNENKNHYTLNHERLSTILEAKSKRDSLMNFGTIEFSNNKPVQARKTNREKNVETLKRSLHIEDPLLRNYFCDWIDSVYATPKGFLTPASLKMAEEEILAYSKSNDVRIEVMKIAVKNGYRDMNWSISAYEKNKGDGGISFVRYSDIKSDGSNTVEEVF